MKKVTKKTLIELGLKSDGRWFNHNHNSYKETWFIGNFSLCFSKKGKLQVYCVDEFIKEIPNEKILNAFLIFAEYEFRKI
jgi:hypothetical protein